MDHDADTIARDYALSERLGEEILRLGAAEHVPAVLVRRYVDYPVKGFADGEVWYGRRTEEL